MAPDLCDAVRRHCADVARSARWVRIDARAEIAAGGAEGLDPGLHFLDGPTEAVARHILVLDTVNFGSGWLAELFESAIAGTVAITDRLVTHARGRGGPWTPVELRALDARAVADVLALDADHELTRLYAEALRQLGSWLGDRSALEAIAAAGGSAVCFARQLADGMPFFDDPGYYKRAQITANDLVLAGVADFADADRLTVFADNIVPHVLRIDGVLLYDDELAARIDAGEPLASGSPMERELRACAVQACEQIAGRLGVAPRRLDNWLWNRGSDPRYRVGLPHRTYTVFY